MEQFNSANRTRLLAAEVVKHVDRLGLLRRKLENRLHVANGFFNGLKEKKIT